MRSDAYKLLFWVAVFMVLCLLTASAYGQGRWENVDQNVRKFEKESNHRFRVKVGQSDKRSDAGIEIINWQGIDDSTYFRVGLGVPSLGFEQIGDTVSITTADFIARYYMLSNTDTEWEIILPVKPSGDPIWTFPIEHNNLTVHLQDSTDFDPAIDTRVDRIWFSHLFLHATRAWNKSGTNENFQTGRAFRIYRLKAIDANGDWIWLDLLIDMAGNTFTISEPKSESGWFRNAAYPVIIDPQFGNTSTPDGTLRSTGNRFWGSIFTMGGTAGTMDSIVCYYVASADACVGLYDASGNYVDSSTACTFTSGSTWHQFTVTENASVSASTDYIMGTNDCGVDGSHYWDTVTDAGRWRADTCPSNASYSFSTNTNYYHIYGVYTEAEAGDDYPMRRRRASQRLTGGQ